MLDVINMQGTVVIGEGEKDEAPMLYNGEAVGNGEGPERRRRRRPARRDAADRKRRTERDRRHRRRRPGDDVLSGRGRLHGQDRRRPCRRRTSIDIDAPPAENVRRAAAAKGMRPEDVTVVVLDRDRHADLIAELREVGAKVHLITDGDVAPSIAAARQGAASIS